MSFDTGRLKYLKEKRLQTFLIDDNLLQLGQLQPLALPTWYPKPIPEHARRLSTENIIAKSNPLRPIQSKPAPLPPKDVPSLLEQASRAIPAKSGARSPQLPMNNVRPLPVPSSMMPPMPPTFHPGSVSTLPSSPPPPPTPIHIRDAPPPPNKAKRPPPSPVRITVNAQGKSNYGPKKDEHDDDLDRGRYGTREDKEDRQDDYRNRRSPSYGRREQQNNYHDDRNNNDYDRGRRSDGPSSTEKKGGYGPRRDQERRRSRSHHGRSPSHNRVKTEVPDPIEEQRRAEIRRKEIQQQIDDAKARGYGPKRKRVKMEKEPNNNTEEVPDNPPWREDPPWREEQREDPPWRETEPEPNHLKMDDKNALPSAGRYGPKKKNTREQNGTRTNNAITSTSHTVGKRRTNSRTQTSNGTACGNIITTIIFCNYRIIFRSF